MKELKELVVIEPEKALTVFTTDKALEPYLKLVKVEIDKHVPDVSTKKGREAIASLAYKVAQVKQAVDKIGKDLKDEQKKIPDLIDAARNYAKETLQAWQDECRKPLTDWEEAEEKRISRIKEALGDLTSSATWCRDQWDTTPLESMQGYLKEAEEAPMDKAHWDEFLDEAIYSQEQAILAIKAAIERRTKHDAEQAELAELRRKNAEREEADRIERLKKEQEERDERLRQEAADKARAAAEAERQAELDRIAKERQDAEDAARAEREAAERREQQLKDEAEQAQRELAEAAERAEREAIAAKEREAAAIKETEDRIAREAEAARLKEVADLAKREANKRHAAKINNEALQAFIAGGLTEECAKTAVTLIAKKSIPHVSIAY